MGVTKSNDVDEYLTPQEAAALLPQTSAHTVLRWAKTGRVPYVELPAGRRPRKFFRRKDIEALLKPRVASAPSAGSPSAAGEGQGTLL